MTGDFALLQDGTRKPISDFADGELLVACQRGHVRCIAHFTRARPKAAGFRERAPKPLTESQRECLGGTP